MAKARNTAIIMVAREWFEMTLGRIVMPAPRRNTTEAAVHELWVEGGLWEREAEGLRVTVNPPNQLQRVDGKPATVEVLIPWRFVWALAEPDDAPKEQSIGFGGGDNVTILKA
jgi:hypothetical protein